MTATESVRGYGVTINPAATLAVLVSRLREAAGKAERAYLQRELTQIADQLLCVRKAIMEVGTADTGADRHRPDYYKDRRAREKNPEPGLRRCSICRALLPVAMFAVSDTTTGKLRADCKPCYNERQRTRYVRAGYKIVTVELLDGDPCVGHRCPVCDQRFEVGQHVQGDNVRHANCHTITNMATL